MLIVFFIVILSQMAHQIREITSNAAGRQAIRILLTNDKLVCFELLASHILG